MLLLIMVNVVIIGSITLWQKAQESDSAGLNAYLSALIGVGMTLINYVTKILLRPLTAKEHLPTKTSLELSVFNKLAFAFMCNAVLVPLVEFSTPFFLTQAFYETGGLASAVIYAVIFDAAGYTLRVFQIPPLFQRFVLAPLTARSQAKLDKCYAPSPHFIGELHAHLLKTFAVPLVYGPLYPPLYLFGAVALVYAFVMCRFALSFWWLRPPQLDDELLQRLRAAIALCLWLHFGVAAAAILSVESNQHWWGAVGRTIVCVVLWLIYAFAPLGRLPCLKRYTLAEGKAGDSVLHYADHDVERYECPSLGGPNTSRATQLERRFNRDIKGWRFYKTHVPSASSSGTSVSPTPKSMVAPEELVVSVSQ